MLRIKDTTISLTLGGDSIAQNKRKYNSSYQRRQFEA